ncbi:uncharacterized protein Nmag_0867 [Natrialba magadii ATCC 43099]|uniref:Uncharacterized protein n=1 Tax=Natrialba magadii (strain ATCC 43099 / DSM 3394 / CCM 3739 / CIP 104546 / IAM 13178 / JCM 8861 / NBRC 102185 / NCIMB 2190 / MS3) TaxID=547559 RepID=D3T093_NATMM|nr:hypothetical protein [Natrialba magadii]ADD04451.1 uncharacterized protein Nmag_0867 [Natrialba magadii ATCC 43099]ELY25846.1 hypothetical protein C500_16849 [Natrialba magadii ATCC 43099]
MSAPQDNASWQALLELPPILERLEDTGGIPVLELVEQLSEQHDLGIEAEGIAYHDRGIRVPGYDATFVHEPTGSRGRPAFSVEVNSVGSRNTWGIFDKTNSWDVYLVQAPGIAALAWISDEEYRVEEAEQFETKQDAVAAGRFSFGIFLYGGDAWQEQLEYMRRTNAPAYLQREDGSTMHPSTQSEFFQLVDSSPTEFRTSGNAPSYLGLLELEVTID